MMNTDRLSPADLDLAAFKALLDTEHPKPALADRVER